MCRQRAVNTYVLHNMKFSSGIRVLENDFSRNRWNGTGIMLGHAVLMGMTDLRVWVKMLTAMGEHESERSLFILVGGTMICDINV